MSEKSADIKVPLGTSRQESKQRTTQIGTDEHEQPIVAIINYREGDRWQQISVRAGEAIELCDDIGEAFVEVQALRSRGD